MPNIEWEICQGNRRESNVISFQATVGYVLLITHRGTGYFAIELPFKELSSYTLFTNVRFPLHMAERNFYITP